MAEISENNLAEKVRQANIEVHRKEADVYDQIHTEIFNSYEQQRIWSDIHFVKTLTEKDHPSLLDIGCGTGNLALKFSQLGFSVIGLDISASMLKILRAKDNAIPLVCADVEQFFLMAPQQYEVISFSSVLHHLVDYTHVLKLCSKRLAQRGVLYITHEPLPGTGQPPIWHRSAAQITRPLRRKLFALRGQELPNIDYSLSDFHLKEGLNNQELAQFLENQGYRIRKTERYLSSRYSIWTFIGNRFLKSKANTFSLIVQRG